MILAGIHRALITDPMSIENDMHQADAGRHVRIGLAAELSLGLVAAVVFATCGAVLIALGQHEFGICFLGLSPWLPCLLAQDYWRWVGFMKSQPQKALANDVVFDTLQVLTFAGLFLAGIRSPLMAIGAWGVGAAAGALFGLRQFSTLPSLRGGISRIRDRWHLSKWLVAVSATSQATSQSTLVLTGAFLGPTGIGGLKSAVSLVSGPSMVLIQAGGNIGLPEATKALRERGWPGLRHVLRLVTMAGMASVGVIAAVVLCFGRQLLVLIYGHAFGRFASVADILAVSYFTSTLCVGAILGLKATRQMRRMFPVSMISLVVSIVSVVVLAPLFGIVGAAVATMIGNAAMTIGLLIAHWTTSRRAAEGMGPGSPAAPGQLPPGPDPAIDGLTVPPDGDGPDRRAEASTARRGR